MSIKSQRDLMLLEQNRLSTVELIEERIRLRAERNELDRKLRDLVATILNDQGRYVEEHGLDAAIDEAKVRWWGMRNKAGGE